MKKSKVIVGISIALVLMFPFSVFAATSDNTAAKSIRGFLGIDTSKLTEKQKADVKDYSKKLTDLKQDFINRMVENGALTKEQGDAAAEKVKDAIKRSEAEGRVPGFGKGLVKGELKKGMVDTSKLTDAQKAELKQIYSKIADEEKSMISKLVLAGVLTSEQGTEACRRIDEHFNNASENWDFKGLMFGRIKGFCPPGFDNSKLTDQIKADLKASAKNTIELQKEAVSKLVSFGAISELQGKAIAEKMDNMQKRIDESNFEFDKGMKRLQKEGMIKRNLDGKIKTSPDGNQKVQ